MLMVLELSLTVRSNSVFLCQGRTTVVTSIYGPKQCATGFAENSELANIVVNICYTNEKDCRRERGLFP